MKKIFLLICCFTLMTISEAQVLDSLQQKENAEIKSYKSLHKKCNIKPNAKSFILPATLITYGFISLGNDG